MNERGGEVKRSSPILTGGSRAQFGDAKVKAKKALRPRRTILIGEMVQNTNLEEYSGTEKKGTGGRLRKLLNACGGRKTTNLKKGLSGRRITHAKKLLKEKISWGEKNNVFWTW